MDVFRGEGADGLPVAAVGSGHNQAADARCGCGVLDGGAVGGKGGIGQMAMAVGQLHRLLGFGWLR